MVPCCHALAAGRVRNIDPYTLLSLCYFVGPWRAKYKGVVMPRPNEKDHNIPEECTDVAVNPPRTKRQGRRPKKKRIPSQGEVHHKKKRITKCGRCFGQGHNRKTCSTLI
ncbi:PREDICTED: uncharacterized protein LOC104728836 [Camelina sativa]|uniref:Uncharacterized protein LOC104728836 n=1 Tax=Camelina sativa TaxID=90675 RepID=A0ABM0UTF9_CAMSA|nr:PREDICTED: uncharacterized protein LOC104728836 [Camelina sativa]